MAVSVAPRSGVEVADAASGPFIVVGVDGSEASSRALAWAAEEARLRGATLKVVEAWHIPSAAYGTYFTPIGSIAEWRDDAALQLKQQLEQVVGSTSPVPLVTEVVQGLAGQVLLDISKDAAMLVVGSRGHGSVSSLLLGSVSAHVAHHATCPVVIVR